MFCGQLATLKLKNTCTILRNHNTKYIQNWWSSATSRPNKRNSTHTNELCKVLGTASQASKLWKLAWTKLHKRNRCYVLDVACAKPNFLQQNEVLDPIREAISPTTCIFESQIPTTSESDKTPLQKDSLAMLNLVKRQDNDWWQRMLWGVEDKSRNSPCMKNESRYWNSCVTTDRHTQ